MDEVGWQFRRGCRRDRATKAHDAHDAPVPKVTNPALLCEIDRHLPSFSRRLRQAVLSTPQIWTTSCATRKKPPCREMSSSAVISISDGLARCPWATTHPANQLYHDHEWGVPVRGERALFERICLEAFQAGLSWLTILLKREAFRDAFRGFDPDRVAALTDEDLDRLMDNERIVRNRRKIEAARSNARATISLRENGGLDRLIWSFQPEAALTPSTTADLPVMTPESQALSRELKRRGFRFVGPTTMFALMCAIGMIDAHLTGCHRRGIAGSSHHQPPD